MAVLVAGVFLAVTRLGGGSDGPLPQPEVAAASPSPTVTVTPTAEPSLDPLAPARQSAEAPDLDGVSVQLLDAGGGQEAVEEIVALLTEAGATISAQGRAATRYTETTVFYGDGFLDLARDLRRFDARFVVVEPNERLSDAIDLHVVVGTDWDLASQPSS